MRENVLSLLPGAWRGCVTTYVQPWTLKLALGIESALNGVQKT